MKARADAIIQREQAEYLDKLSVQRDPLLAEMESSSDPADLAIGEAAVYSANFGDATVTRIEPEG